MINGKYLPKNRLPRELPILRIEIEDKDGLMVFDPNGLVLACHQGEHVQWLRNPELKSDVSGRPGAVKYRSQNIELNLSPHEIYQLVMLQLSPRSFFRLAGKYGIFFEIHDDYYDMETGEALQPRG
jgi:hypothetical protein